MQRKEPAVCISSTEECLGCCLRSAWSPAARVLLGQSHCLHGPHQCTGPQLSLGTEALEGLTQEKELLAYTTLHCWWLQLIYSSNEKPIKIMQAFIENLPREITIYRTNEKNRSEAQEKELEQYDFKTDFKDVSAWPFGMDAKMEREVSGTLKIRRYDIQHIFRSWKISNWVWDCWCSFDFAGILGQP